MATGDIPLKKIGFISKLNGYKGELVLAADGADFFEEKFLFMVMDGIPVPFAVEEIFEKGGGVVIKLEDVNDIDHAQRFLRSEVFMQQKKKKKTAGKVSDHNLAGYRLVDASFGDLGPIVRIDELPQQEIAVCVVNQKEVLIPLNDDFIDEIDDVNRRIQVTLPDGLIALYL
jgi:16S rRNA processing protein RimM